MTLLSQGKPARRRSFWVDAKVDGTVYDMYTCPANCTAEVDMIHVVNANGNTSVFVYWSIAAANVPPALQATYPTGYTSNLVGGKNMSVGEYFTLTGSTLVLQPGDKIQVKSSGANPPHVDAVCSVTETFVPVG